MLRVPRSRGALSGVILVLLGLWGGLAALVGPYFHFAFTPDKAWSFTAGRVWLEILPACALLVGGLILLGSANRATAAIGAWIAALGGAWYVVGGTLSTMWAASDRLGVPVGGTTRQVVEQITLLSGLGAVAVFFAAVALGRLAVVGVKDARLAEREAAHAEAAPTVETPRPAHDDRPAATGPIPPARADRPGPIQATQPLPRRTGRAPVTPPEQAVPRPAEQTVPPTREHAAPWPPESAAPRAPEPTDRRVAGGSAEDTGSFRRPGEGA
ncbi:hypothetical protein [Actinoallomurus rhizosphaericola]|uniref:hypothetical protein n=1 Tax=Actinoallomurus rhizosphaericola TaxID=2952536 RepID=UPI002093DC70|nr:hypothetical protein [Actinoallomurus rhizosphaericola]MCO5998341.1 hypothetical protein [Actinoallomurus rhizosphaericola]